MITPGSILMYEKGTYKVVEGESIFDLYKTLPIDSQYCKREDLYYTPKGGLTKKQVDVLKGVKTENSEKGFFRKIYDKWQEIKQKIVNLFK